MGSMLFYESSYLKIEQNLLRRYYGKSKVREK
jgi:hypothetical protein